MPMTRSMLSSWLTLLWCVRAQEDEGVCLPEAVPFAQRSLLQSNDGEFPLGLWVNGNPVDLVISAAFEILAQEVLGIQVWTDPRRNRFAPDGFFALAGCIHESEWDCTEIANRASRIHVMLAARLEGNEVELAEVQRSRVGGMIDVVSTVGVDLQESLHYSQAWNANSDARSAGLEYFRTYDAQARPSTVEYFSRIQDVNDSGLLLPCAAFGSYSPHILQNYLTATGDADGIVVGPTPSDIRLRCTDPNWWFAPACRRNPQECIPTVTCSSYGFVWYVEEIVWKAAAYNMPLAVGAGAGCGKDSDFAQLPQRYNLLFYYWAPDAMLNTVEPAPVIFPAFSIKAWQADDWSRSFPSIPLMALMNQDMNLWAPQIRIFLSQMKWEMTDINSLLASLNEAMMWNETLAIACQWLKENRNFWQGWIPESTTCLAGQGLYSSVEGRFVRHRANATTCRACFPGHHSQGVADNGATAICVPCEAGRSQASYGSISCNPCLPGTIMPFTGATLCEKCIQGEYQDAEAQMHCISCHVAETTRILGATAHSDCECKAGYFWQNSSQLCEICKEGLFCQGGNAPPQQEKGFWIEVSGSSNGDLSFSTFACRPEKRCPAGALGGCSDHSSGRACGYCQLGFFSAANGDCRSCSSEAVAWPLVLAMLLVLAVGSWPVFQRNVKSLGNSRVTASLLVVAVMVGQGVACIQCLEAIRQFEIDWTEPVASWLAMLSFISFDLEFFGLGCYVSSAEVNVIYMCKLLFVPVFVCCTLVTFLLTRAVASRWMMSTPDVQSLTRIYLLLLVSLYTGLSLMVFMPFECRGNPNGISTLAANPQVICGDVEHISLLVLAVLGVLAYPLAIFAALVRITWKYPAWLCSSKGIETVQQFQVIFGKFKPERYYYCLLVTGSNLIIASIPAIILSYPVLQVSVMCCVISLKQVLLCFLWPWKEDVANWTDLILAGGLVLLMTLVVPRADANDSGQTLAIVMAIVVISFPVSLFGGAIAYITSKLRSPGSYAAFLCHCKGSSGVLCRYLKLMMKKANPNAKVFYDADNLVDLTHLFQIVRSDVKCLVVVLSPGLFQSPWCTGEICTAFAGDVPMICVAADGCTVPDDDKVNRIISIWTEEHRSVLMNYGFDQKAVQTAFAYLHRVPVVELHRSHSPEAQEKAAFKVGAAARVLEGLLESPFSLSASKAVVLVCGGAASATSPEAVSACLVLQLQLQVALQVPTLFVQSASEVLAAGRAVCLVVVLTKGLLETPHFREILRVRPNLTRLALSDGTFEFPRTYFKRITNAVSLDGEKDEIEDPEEVQEHNDLVAAIQSLCMYIALPWTPQGSEALMDQQLREICSRISSFEFSPAIQDSDSRVSPAGTESSTGGRHLPGQEEDEEADEEVEVKF